MIVNILRWIFFLPAGLLMQTAVILIPVLLWAKIPSVGVSELSAAGLVLLIAIGMVALPLLGLWFVLMISVPVLVCGKIAPEPRIASVLYSLVHLWFLVWLFFPVELPVLSLIYYSVSYIIVIFSSLVSGFGGD